MESILSASLIVLVVRTPRSLWRSMPGRPLALATLLVAMIAVALPFSPIASLLGLAPLPFGVMTLLVGIVVLYVLAAAWTKRVFYRHVSL